MRALYLSHGQADRQKKRVGQEDPRNKLDIEYIIGGWEGGWMDGWIGDR